MLRERTEEDMSWLSKKNHTPATSGLTKSATVLVGGVGSQSSVAGPPDRRSGWEYLYLATQLADGIHQMDDEYDKYMSGEVVPNGVTVSDPIQDAKARSDVAKDIVARVDNLFAPKLLEKAFGPTGVAGDEATIRFVAAGVVGVYRSCLEWGEEIRGTAVPEQWQPLYAALADMVTLPMQQMRNFSDDFLSTVKESVECVRAGKTTGRVLNFTLKISIDPTVSQRFERAIETLKNSR
jgi:hypothetical protein